MRRFALGAAWKNAFLDNYCSPGFPAPNWTLILHDALRNYSQVDSSFLGETSFPRSS